MVKVRKFKLYSSRYTNHGTAPSITFWNEKFNITLMDHNTQIASAQNGMSKRLFISDTNLQSEVNCLHSCPTELSRVEGHFVAQTNYKEKEYRHVVYSSDLHLLRQPLQISATVPFPSTPHFHPCRIDMLAIL